MRLHDYPASGNCYKVRLLLAQLGRDYERVNVDIFDGGTLTDEFGALNPTRTTPCWSSTTAMLLESNAILTYLAEGADLVPDDPVERPRDALALLRAGRDRAEHRQPAGAPGGRGAAAGPPGRPAHARGRGALPGRARGHLSERTFLVGERYTIADLCVYAYVHVAGDATLDLADFPAVSAWIARVEATPGFVDDLQPIPPDTRFGAGRSIYG